VEELVFSGFWKRVPTEGMDAQEYEDELRKAREIIAAQADRIAEEEAEAILGPSFAGIGVQELKPMGGSPAVTQRLPNGHGAKKSPPCGGSKVRQCGRGAISAGAVSTLRCRCRRRQALTRR
jgi:hypothetical protein